MNNQLRVTAILLGSLLVIATFTFPAWQRYTSLLPGGTGVVLPCLPPQANEAFLLLEDELRTNLLSLAEEELALACELIFAHLSQDDPVPPPQQTMPEDLPEGERVGDGRFVAASPALEASGTLSIFELADGRHLLRIDELDVTNVPDMGLWLAANTTPTTEEELQQGGVFQLIDTLQGNIGSQNYILAADVDLSRYNSIVLYSEPLGIVVSYANFIQF